MSQLPDPQSLNELADAFERLQGRRIDPKDRSTSEQRQQALQALGSMGAALVGAVAGYSARGRQ